MRESWLTIWKVSEVYKRRETLQAKLSHLEDFDVSSPETSSPIVDSAASYMDAGDLSHLTRRRKSFHDDTKDTQNLDEDITTVTSAIEHDTPLSLAQTRSLRRLMKWEIERLSEELKGKCTVTTNYYPQNLNWKDFYAYIPLPTVVYELEYPR